MMVLHLFNNFSVILILDGALLTDMGRINLKSNALNQHYLPKLCIELALPLLNFEKVMH